MDSQTKRTLLAAVLMVGIMLGWFKLQAYLYPIPPSNPAASQPVAQSSQPSTTGNAVGPSTTGPAITQNQTGNGATSNALVAIPATPVEPITIGNDAQDKPDGSFKNPYEFAATISPRGAAIERLNLSRHRNHVAAHPKQPDHDPYHLLTPLKDPVKGLDRLSFASRTIKIDNDTISLDDLIWSAREVKAADSEAVELQTTLQRDGVDFMRIVKSFRATEHDPHLALTIKIENLSSQPHQIILTESGPCGITRDDARVATYGHVVAALIDPEKKISVGAHPLRTDVHKLPDRELVLREDENKHTLWAALSNKYFTSIVAPKLKGNEWYPTELAQVVAEAPNPEAEADDLTFRYVLTPGRVEPKATTVFNIDVYCGPKSKPNLEKIPLAVQRDYYAVITRPDVSYCTFDALGRAMHWLVTHIYNVVGNYGIAIICLVIVVKTILHPLSKRGQLVMTRTQRGMARLKPKLDALNEQYKGDKQKLSAETFKLYREEGVSPAGPMLGCLPMFIQIPIWGALWSMLNTNVDIRHQPFMLWMRDLTSPDALISLPPSMHFHVPLLSGMMGGPITAFNILPVVMVITMYAQQKIMQKLTQPENKPAPKLDAQGRPIPDPMEQQQKMMPYMMGFMGLLFYNSPSGLNLYIWVNSLLGVVEQFQIRRVIKHMEERGELVEKKPPSDGGPGNRTLSASPSGPPKSGWLANLQKKVEAMQQQAQAQRDRAESGRGKKKPKH